MKYFLFLLTVLLLACQPETSTGDGTTIGEAVTSQPAPGIATGEPEEAAGPDLTAAATNAASEGTLTGTYVYFADAALFTDCGTKRRYPVAFEGANLELERAYGALEMDQPNPVLVTVEGVIEDRRGQVEGALKDVLIVTKLISMDQNGTCADR